MATIHRLHISPTLMNSSSVWASEEKQLKELYECQYTGAVTTRTATLKGFPENYPTEHTMAFSSESLSSVNSYGYSPHPLSQYLLWVESLLQNKKSTKPVVISITSSSPSELRNMVHAVQQLRQKIGDENGESSRIGIELNTSCPNIANAPPPAYAPTALSPLLAVLAMAFWTDRTLTIGLKLPPYTYSTQFTDMLSLIASLSRDIDGERYNPIAFLSCTNTLGTSLLFTEQALPAGHERNSTKDEGGSRFALPTPLGGLAGEAIHALSLGNVYTFSKLISSSGDVAVQRISVVGIGGVTTPAAVARMRNAGAKVVASATLFGREGIRAFELLSQPPREE
ncbi:FMN-linked oxidoreductase [Fomitiporia mediterranea MF3/22]|uniref:FMN-linked oxidoreductase n=1 Tax=Fomitiporia mediterranea (strain MF3/22) TaxID=694068 RepID=UPI0004407933|nr:FMN-linked oxidoreductase [Fomitiporia mediterranea MF3/22]EJD04414.1 FMN-linked oxidoreductase [Fomitiporia mediterranea MF3/22]